MLIRVIRRRAPVGGERSLCEGPRLPSVLSASPTVSASIATTNRPGVYRIVKRELEATSGPVKMGGEARYEVVKTCARLTATNAQLKEIATRQARKIQQLRQEVDRLKAQSTSSSTSEAVGSTAAPPQQLRPEIGRPTTQCSSSSTHEAIESAAALHDVRLQSADYELNECDVAEEVVETDVAEETEIANRPSGYADSPMKGIAKGSSGYGVPPTKGIAKGSLGYGGLPGSGITRSSYEYKGLPVKRVGKGFFRCEDPPVEPIAKRAKMEHKEGEITKKKRKKRVHVDWSTPCVRRALVKISEMRGKCTSKQLLDIFEKYTGMRLSRATIFLHLRKEFGNQHREVYKEPPETSVNFVHLTTSKGGKSLGVFEGNSVRIYQRLKSSGSGTRKYYRCFKCDNLRRKSGITSGRVPSAIENDGKWVEVRGHHLPGCQTHSLSNLRATEITRRSKIALASDTSLLPQHSWAQGYECAQVEGVASQYPKWKNCRRSFQRWHCRESGKAKRRRLAQDAAARDDSLVVEQTVDE